jgi:hypothetical protein
VLYFNPGSAGPRRFHLPVSVGRLMIGAGKVRAQLVELEIYPSKEKRPTRKPALSCFQPFRGQGCLRHTTVSSARSRPSRLSPRGTLLPSSP